MIKKLAAKINPVKKKENLSRMIKGAIIAGVVPGTKNNDRKAEPSETRLKRLTNKWLRFTAIESSMIMEAAAIVTKGIRGWNSIEVILKVLCTK